MKFAAIATLCALALMSNGAAANAIFGPVTKCTDEKYVDSEVCRCTHVENPTEYSSINDISKIKLCANTKESEVGTVHSKLYNKNRLGKIVLVTVDVPKDIICKYDAPETYEECAESSGEWYGNLLNFCMEARKDINGEVVVTTHVKYVGNDLTFYTLGESKIMC